jgi:hypothetical protein
MFKTVILFFIANWNIYPLLGVLPFHSIADTTSCYSITPFLADSSKVNNYTTLLATFSTSVIENKNWKSMDFRNYSLQGNVDYDRKVAAPHFKKLYQLSGELGFLKFIDSSWYKNSDNLNLSSQWTNYSSKTLTPSYSVILKTQFTDTWKYTTDINGESRKEWSGGILNPAALTIAYGLNYDFWKRCFINLAIATIKINSRPVSDEALLPGQKELSRSQKMLVIGEYGLSLQSTISKKIYENVSWDGKTQFFTNGFKKNQVTLDFQNRLTFAFPKCLQFRADTHIVYDPLYSFRLQYKHELLVGLSIKKKK